MVDDIQYGCVTPSVMGGGGGTSLVRWRVCNTDLSHQYRCVTSSVRWRVCSKDLSHHQYGCVASSVWTCHIISTEEGVQYWTTKTAQRAVGGCIYLGKMMFYRQSYYKLVKIRSYPHVLIYTFQISGSATLTPRSSR